MNTPRLLLFAPFLPPHTYLPSREQNVHPEVFSFECRASLGNHGYIPVSKPRSFFAVVNRCSHRFTLECHSLHALLFYLMRLIELIIPSPRAMKKNYTLLLKISFPKGYQEIKKSINQFIYVNTWDGVAPIIRAQGSCMKRMTKYIMDFLYRFLSFNKQLFQPLNLY